MRTLCKLGKLAHLAAEIRRCRLEILGVSEARWNQFGDETELATRELPMIFRKREHRCVQHYSSRNWDESGNVGINVSHN